MKDYAIRKKNKKWSLAKSKIVDVPAVSEVKDDKGVVVREAKDEVSHEVVKLTKKTFNPETGAAGTDNVQTVTVAECDNKIAQCDNQIAEQNAEKAGWEALKTDIKAL
tara:strand:+ start:542 stop:865 length:324 start_codon:yes stop_codon:yes gene_type:complete